MRDLGVVLDSTLSFTPHITQIASTAKQRMFLLFRTFLTKDSGALIQGFKSYILPPLNYGSSVWSSSSIGDIMIIESLQQKFTKKIPSVENLSHVNRLKVPKLPTLELRCLYADVLLCYKILNGIVVGPPENFGLFLSDRNSCDHSKKLLISHVRVYVKKNYFGCRICGPWNSLPDNVVNASSVNSFKRLIKSCDFNRFLIFTE